MSVIGAESSILGCFLVPGPRLVLKTSRCQVQFSCPVRLWCRVQNPGVLFGARSKLGVEKLMVPGPVLVPVAGAAQLPRLLLGASSDVGDRTACLLADALPPAYYSATTRVVVSERELDASIGNGLPSWGLTIVLPDEEVHQH